MHSNNEIDEIEPCIQEIQKIPTFLQFSSKMDIHGYYFIGKEKGLRKFLWCVLFISAVVFSVLMALRCVRAYLTYTVYQELKDFPYLERDLFLPTITVCNQVSLIEQSYLRLKHLAGVTEREYEEFHTRYLTKYGSHIKPNKKTEQRILDALLKNNITTMEEVYNFFEINYKEMFEDPIANILLKSKHQTYPTCRYNNYRKCTVKNTFSNRESLCYQMNYFKPHSRPKKGWDHKKKWFRNYAVVVNTQSTRKFLKTIRFDPRAPFMDLVEGLVVYVHDYGSMHDSKHVSQQLFLRPGKMHFINIDFVEVHHLPPPYPRGCGKRKFNIINQSTIPYTKAMCDVDCMLELLNKTCGCVGWEFRSLSDLPICNISRSQCILKNKEIVEIQCEKAGCPLDCIHQKYNTRIVTTDLHTDDILNTVTLLPGWKLNESETSQYIEKNLVGLHVQYTSSAKIEYHRPTVTWINLIGTLGGNLGVCTGFSIIVFFQFVQYVIDYVNLLRNKKVEDKSTIIADTDDEHERKSTDQISDKKEIEETRLD